MSSNMRILLTILAVFSISLSVGDHAWVQAYVGGKWVSIDTSFKSAGLGCYDAGHIALAQGNGNPESFFSLLSNVGQFRIDKVIIR